MSGIDSGDYVHYMANIEAMYFRMNCDNFLSKVDSHFEFQNTTWFGDLQWNQNTLGQTNVSDHNMEPFTFVWSMSENHDRMICTVNTTYAEVEVSCPTHDTCSASRIRRSRLEQPPAAYTALGQEYDEFQGYPRESFGFPFGDIFRIYEPRSKWQHIMLSRSELFSAGYVQDPLNPSNMSIYLFPPTLDNITIRLNQLLNSYWQAMNGKYTVAATLDAETAWLDKNTSWVYQNTATRDLKSSIFGNISSYTSFYDYPYFLAARTWQTTSTKVNNMEVFQAHYGWVIALMVSSTTLITASLVSFYIRTFLSHGPDILMNLSSLAVRDNPYIALPVTGTYLDAADRSRYLKDLRIRYGDVVGGGEVGRLAIGRVDRDVGEWRKGRKYI
jgi:hypothetical protein